MLTIHKKLNYFKCNFASILKAMRISVYMRINTHSPQEIFSKGKFLFYLFYLFYEFYNKCENITM